MNVWLHFDQMSFKGVLSSGFNLKSDLWAEAAFTTAMTGYEESITDPSYLGQHLIFATSHVGNYKPNVIRWQNSFKSPFSFAQSVIVRELTENAFFKELNVPVISQVDTRSLVRFLVNHPSPSVLSLSEVPPSVEIFKKNKKMIQQNCSDLSVVSVKKTYWAKKTDGPVLGLINYGCKKAIRQRLLEGKYSCVEFPYNVSAQEVLSYSPDLVLLSNGPGDPRFYTKEVEVIKLLLKEQVPLRGICLGHQLLSMALGAEIVSLPFGQRGVNHPVFDHETGEVLITSQNHGYAVKAKENVEITHTSLFDDSVEGIRCKGVRSVQFHPEAFPGPKDGDIFFQEIETFLEQKFQSSLDLRPLPRCMDKTPLFKKVLIVGPGPIRIGQACEFDYSATQACKVLREKGLEVILLNPNPATIMTDPELAHRTYVGPLTEEYLQDIILKEKVDALLSTMGAQTALNLCLALDRSGFLQNHDVALLGASGDTIEKTENRELFAKELESLGLRTGVRLKAFTPQEALTKSKEISFPLIIRRDYALGGKGALLLKSSEELKKVLEEETNFPITMEKSLLGHKEVEFEVMVDKEKNGVIVCSIENIDPCGVHTGDSVTVAPALTLSDETYQRLRRMSLQIAKHLGVVAGGANVQFAIHPEDESDIVVIEMNPRVSRSSALASKATGYPIAKISALLAVGYTLKDIQNDITKSSPVVFEPTQDYVAVKIPKFAFHKFPASSSELGPSMKSVGEVLALGGSFNEAYLKALRSLESGGEVPAFYEGESCEDLLKDLRKPLPNALLRVLECLRKGASLEEILNHTKITPWFIKQMELIVKKEKNIDSFNLRTLKSIGFSDKYLAMLKGLREKDIYDQRKREGVFPSFYPVDTCSGEFSALTPYFYSTYPAFPSEVEKINPKQKSVIVLGSGPNRIGQGIEFDYSCVHVCQRLKEENIPSIMINSNPETVSTDYDTSDRLYLSALYAEDLRDIFNFERPQGIVSSFSGQTGICLREDMDEDDFPFLGPDLKTLKVCEDRFEFGKLIETLGLDHNPGLEIHSKKDLIDALVKIGPPVIIRPSFVIGGDSMYIIKSIEDLPDVVQKSLSTSRVHFQVEKYLENAVEYDVDLVRDRFGNTLFCVCEHIEYAGVHSGDSGMIVPPIHLKDSLLKRLKSFSILIAQKLELQGVLNLQFAIQGEDIYCLEANPRGSRTIPFLSKAYNCFLAKSALDAMLGKKISSELEEKKFYSVKQSTFPFDRFLSDSIILGPRMRSTGETMGMAKDLPTAVLYSYLGNFPSLQTIGPLLLSLCEKDKKLLLPYLKDLNSKGYEFWGTEGTAYFIRDNGYSCKSVGKVHDSGDTIVSVLKHTPFVFVANTPFNQGDSRSEGDLIRHTAISYGIPTFTRPENIESLFKALIYYKQSVPVSLQEFHYGQSIFCS